MSVGLAWSFARLQSPFAMTHAVCNIPRDLSNRLLTTPTPTCSTTDRRFGFPLHRPYQPSLCFLI